MEPVCYSKIMVTFYKSKQHHNQNIIVDNKISCNNQRETEVNCFIILCSVRKFMFCFQKLQTLLLGPLSELSSVPHGDVRQRQLECVLQVLHGAGETLSHGWPLVLGIIGAVSDHHG